MALMLEWFDAWLQRDIAGWDASSPRAHEAPRSGHSSHANSLDHQRSRNDGVTALLIEWRCGDGRHLA